MELFLLRNCCSIWSSSLCLSFLGAIHSLCSNNLLPVIHLGSLGAILLRRYVSYPLCLFWGFCCRLYKTWLDHPQVRLLLFLFSHHVIATNLHLVIPAENGANLSRFVYMGCHTTLFRNCPAADRTKASKEEKFKQVGHFWLFRGTISLCSSCCPHHQSIVHP
jgi:hypothetical protein